MADWNKITKKQFDAASNKFPASKWIKFAYDNFSKNPEKMKLKNTLVYTFLSLFLVGFIGTVLNLSPKLIMIITLIYTGVLVILGLYLFTAAILNTIRLKKIIKELGITVEEYNKLLEKFNVK